AGGVAVRAQLLRGGVGRATLERAALMMGKHSTLNVAQAFQPSGSETFSLLNHRLATGKSPNRQAGKPALRWTLSVCLLLLFISLFSSSAQTNTNDQRTLVLVLGAAGETEYGEQFSAWAELCQRAAAQGGLQVETIGTSTNDVPDDRTRLLE